MVAKDGIGNTHCLEQRKRHLTLLHMLRFVVYPRFTTPPDNEQYGNTVHIAISEREQRIDRVALTAVLHVNNGDAASGQMVASSQTYSPTLVGSNDVVASRCMVGDVGTEVLQQRIRHTGVEVDALCC